MSYLTHLIFMLSKNIWHYIFLNTLKSNLMIDRICIYCSEFPKYRKTLKLGSDYSNFHPVKY